MHTEVLQKRYQWKDNSNHDVMDTTIIDLKLSTKSYILRLGPVWLMIHLGSETTITTGEWSCLILFARAPPSCKEGTRVKRKIQNENVSFGYQTSDSWLFSQKHRLIGHQDSCLAALKLFQNPVMNNTWQYIWLLFCVFMLSSM